MAEELLELQELWDDGREGGREGGRIWSRVVGNRCQSARQSTRVIGGRFAVSLFAVSKFRISKWKI